MRKLMRINRTNNEVIKEYNIRDDEKVIYAEEKIFIVSTKEYDKYIKGEIETYDFDDVSYETENNEILVIE